MYLVDYKGKHWIIRDEPESDDFVVRELSKEEVMEDSFIKKHKELCDYYGVPPYIGKDKDLNKIYNYK